MKIVTYLSILTVFVVFQTINGVCIQKTTFDNANNGQETKVRSSAATIQAATEETTSLANNELVTDARTIVTTGISAETSTTTTTKNKVTTRTTTKKSIDLIQGINFLIRLKIII
jgi:hypothetical protein